MPPFTTAVSVVQPGRVLIRGYSHEAIMKHLTYSEGTYLTLVGRLPTPEERELVEAMLNSLLDHGWVAATITATRYIASGNPQFVPAVAGGLLAAGSNTLSPEHSFELIHDALARKQANGTDVATTARAIVEEYAARKQRIPGFGHPVHREGDFRAEVLFEIAERLGLEGEATEMYRAIHAAFVEVTGKKGIPINIDGCLACLGMDLGLSAQQVVAIALLAVLPGLMAHAIEEIEQNIPLRYIEDGSYVGEEERLLPQEEKQS